MRGKKGLLKINSQLKVSLKQCQALNLLLLLAKGTVFYIKWEGPLQLLMHRICSSCR